MSKALYSVATAANFLASCVGYGAIKVAYPLSKSPFLGGYGVIFLEERRLDPRLGGTVFS